MMIKDDLLTLKNTDVYSLSLFALYKLTGIPEYTTISELPYILDRDNMLKLCEYFGGRTIKVPTVEEIKSLMNLLLLYQYVNIDHIEYEDAIKLIGYESRQLRQVKKTYKELCEILNNYNLQSRSNYDI